MDARFVSHPSPYTKAGAARDIEDEVIDMLQGLLTLPAMLAAAGRTQEEFLTELRYVPEGWLGIVFVALLAGVCWSVVAMYRREGRRGASLRLRTGLGCLRCAVLLLLAVVLLEPVRVRILRKWVDSYTIVLVDQSSSMDLPDTYRDADAKTRAAAVLGADPVSARRTSLVSAVMGADERKLLSDLAKRNRVQLYGFSDGPKLLDTVRAGWEHGGQETAGDGVAGRSGVKDVSLAFAAQGATTNIERAVRRSVESLGSSPVAGVVVFSDGGFNQGASAEDIARFANELEIPIFSIGVGDPSPARNIRVAEVLAPENAFKEDPFSITVRLAAEGLEGESFRLELRERDANRTGGAGRLVDTKTLHISSRGGISPITFERRQERTGRYVFSVTIPELEGETVAEDNVAQVTVNVIDARTRVLLVAGEPSWEYRYLSRLLQRDVTFDLSCWLQSADLTSVRDGNTVIDHLPVLAEELFAYDLIILMDADPSEIDEAWSRLVATFVTEHAGGLLVTAARPHTATLMRESAAKPWVDLLPVSIDPEADLILNRVGHYQLKSAPIEIPSEAFGHPILRMGTDVASTKIAWQGVGSVHWHYPVRRAKPAATVLMRHGDPAMRNADGGHVLCAVQFVGAGRTGFVGFDGTWRWRRFGTEIFDRFWVQLLRHLVESKLLGGSKRGTLMTESDQFSLGDAVTATARLFDARFEPLRRDEVRAHYSVYGERGAFALRPDEDRPGWYEGRFVPNRTGQYRITVTLPTAPGLDPEEVSRELRVSRPNIEIMRPQMDRGNLRTLAERSAGGRYFEIDETKDLADLIPDLHAEIPIRSRPTTLWDNAIVLSLLIGLLCVEWGVRKWKQLL